MPARTAEISWLFIWLHVSFGMLWNRSEPFEIVEARASHTDGGDARRVFVVFLVFIVSIEHGRRFGCSLNGI
jgi:hypothetical protein